MGKRINITSFLAAVQRHMQSATRFLARPRTPSVAIHAVRGWAQRGGKLLLLVAAWGGRGAIPLLRRNAATLLLLVPLLLFLPALLWWQVPNKVAVVMSSSMEPALSMGDLVLLRSTKEIQVGDVVAFNTPGGNPGYPPRLLHRVVEYDQAGARLTTKGDANDDSDPFKVGMESVLGVQRYSVPYGGWVILFLQSHYGKIWLAIVVLVFAYPTLAKIGVWARRSTQQALFEGLSQNVNLGTNGLETERLDRVETGVNETREALLQFSKAIAEYATHLQSHTAAVRGMSEGSQSLQEAVQRQNQILDLLTETLEKGEPKEEGRKDKPPKQRKASSPPGHYQAMKRPSE